MARLATSAAHFCQRLQELYPQKLAIATKHQSEQSSPFRRWTTGSGAGSSYRHHEHRNMYNKQISEGSVSIAGVSGAGGGGVSRWSLGLEHLLADPSGAAAFAHFLANEYAAENIRFWWACEQYAAGAGASRGALAAQIWRTHLDDKASEPVNIDAAARRAAAEHLYLDPPPPDLFVHAQKQIFNVMKFDSYPRFLRSAIHAECARADLLGLPPPYPAAATTHAEHNKLKKSASNASERRRSGGVSLNLPWKTRNVSRDRLNDQPLTDVVKAQAVSSGPPLCRVVLPDGTATSVVGVDGQLTVQRLIQRLLQRRNVVCDNYDVIYTDPKQGESATVDIQAPSTVLSGREVSVERRVVVRIEVAGRCVMVRCRGARRVRHVVRPVAARYQLAPPLAVTRAHRAVHPDTLMQDLDGCRLQVVEATEGSSRIERDHDSDGDSLSDVALRLQDDREQGNQTNTASSSRSNATSTSSAPTTPVTAAPEVPSLSRLPDIAGLPRVPEGPGGSSWAPEVLGVPRAPEVLGVPRAPEVLGMPQAPEVPGIPRVPEGPGVPGRVRAALLFVPPVHHHPPDFLDNLRETQRQRLQSRTPPPLPPKPLRAPPTVV